jgi:Fur family ferric uptake transcriptional regulator
VAENGAQVAARLRGLGYRITPQREAIIEEILAAEGHVTPRLLARKIQKRMPAVNASTVYRTLQLLESAEVVRHFHHEAGAEYHRVEEGKHVHLLCYRCGAGDDLPAALADQLRDLVSRCHGFLPDLTHFAISGLCVACQQAEAAGDPGG